MKTARKQEGFTLIEVLVVLSMSAIFMLFAVSISERLVEKYKTEQFLRTFQSDILYLQQLSMTNSKRFYTLDIQPASHSYTIRQGGLGKVIISRDIPANWTIELNSLKMPITFTYKGTLKNPGTMYLKTDSKTYRIVFPLGKGRSYIVEQ
ncbi:competence type IV pilus minor pilin ComGD [Sediminibacillus massiliensis]|uniref:competence type IV pilus minor pilin ComGD n=1 Tax=Sediminibacillus massiliensis TaxID=1926277 RepID=UPI0009883DEB|nr:competence type IV pilus minor pilin ComGD [Sediminibacillus massiliensis]